MVASIGPFWDANETWLVLGVGILLIAFPEGARRGAERAVPAGGADADRPDPARRGLRLPRQGARTMHKPLWNRAFFAGSALAAVAQGWMLGRYITGFADGAGSYTLFAALIALALPAAYVLLGAAWLIMKTEGELQRKAVALGPARLGRRWCSAWR